jgi:hypothetical protein
MTGFQWVSFETQELLVEKLRANKLGTKFAQGPENTFVKY